MGLKGGNGLGYQEMSIMIKNDAENEPPHVEKKTGGVIAQTAKDDFWRASGRSTPGLLSTSGSADGQTDNGFK